MRLTSSKSGFCQLRCEVQGRRLAYFGEDRDELRARFRKDLNRMYADDAQAFYYHEARVYQLYGLALTDLHLAAVEAGNQLKEKNHDSTEEF